MDNLSESLYKKVQGKSREELCTLLNKFYEEIFEYEQMLNLIKKIISDVKTDHYSVIEKLSKAKRKFENGGHVFEGKPAANDEFLMTFKNLQEFSFSAYQIGYYLCFKKEQKEKEIKELEQYIEKLPKYKDPNITTHEPSVEEEIDSSVDYDPYYDEHDFTHRPEYTDEDSSSQDSSYENPYDNTSR